MHFAYFFLQYSWVSPPRAALAAGSAVEYSVQGADYW
jgi:hypothetical protein